jgi:hypothetical protein
MSLQIVECLPDATASEEGESECESWSELPWTFWRSLFLLIIFSVVVSLVVIFSLRFLEN